MRPRQGSTQNGPLVRPRPVAPGPHNGI